MDNVKKDKEDWYCTECGANVSEKDTFCKKCGADVTEIDEYNKCDNCEKSTGKDDSYCKNCGFLFDFSHKCEIHSNIDAESLCVICKKPLCMDCQTEVSGKYFCSSHSNYHLEKSNRESNMVYTSPDEMMVSHFKNLLEIESIPCVIKNKLLITNGLRPHDYWRELWIFDASQFKQAKEIVDKALSAPSPTGFKWKCSECGEEIEPQFSECWKCGKSRKK